MPVATTLTRRHLIQQTGGSAAAVAALSLAAPAVLRGAEPSSEPVRIGHIGTGVRGGTLVQEFAREKGAKIVAVCDVYKPHVAKAVETCRNPEVKTYADYRDLLADPNVEAVVIATPDHWHEAMVMDAIAAGKDIYCEKGWTMSIDAAKRMHAAIKKSNRVFQLGHQGRQFPAAEAAGKLIRDGAIGPVTMIHTGRFFNGTKEQAPWRWYGWYTEYKHPDPREVIKQLNWEKWLGPAPKIEFNERHFWHWRCYWPYGTGQAGDLLSHELDHVQQALGWGIPDTCQCAGMIAYFDDDRQVPDTWLATYQFEKQRCSLTFEGCMNSDRQQPPEYLGKDGRIIFNAIGQDAWTFSLYGPGSAWKEGKARPEPKMKFDSKAAPKLPTHQGDFLECVRTRRKARCNEDEAFIEAATLLMSLESYRRKRQVRWDPVNQQIL